MASAALRRAPAAGVIPARRLIGRLPGAALSILALSLVMLTGGLQVMQASQAASAGYEIGRLERERDRLNAEIRLLEVEVANMAHSDRVLQQATERLGMVQPTTSVRVAVGVAAPQGIPIPSRFTPPLEVVGPLQRPWWAKVLESLPPVR